MGPKKKSTSPEFSNTEADHDHSKHGTKQNREIPTDRAGDMWVPPYEDNIYDEITREHNFQVQDQIEDQCFERKQELLKDCLKLLEPQNTLFDSPLNIAVIGPPGCGKSSFLNTVFACFDDDRWHELAKCGEFGNHEGVMGMQVSHRLKSYPKKSYYRKPSILLLPTMVDMTGFENDSSPINEELLRLVFQGKVKENEILNDIDTYGRYHGLTTMRQWYRWRFTRRKIKRIIVVCSANPDSPIPTQLFRTVVKVANELDITYYGVLTHTDKYKAGNPRVAEKEELFLKTLGLPRNRFARVVNYCPDVDPDRSYEDAIIPTLNVPVLRLMRQVLTREPYDQTRSAMDYLLMLVSLLSDPLVLFVIILLPLAFMLKVPVFYIMVAVVVTVLYRRSS